jgi:hypothetical protein
MRRGLTVPVLVAGVALYGTVIAAGFAAGFSLSARTAREAETAAPTANNGMAPPSCCADAARDTDQNEASSFAGSQQSAISAAGDPLPLSGMPPSPVLRYGIVELLPDELRQPTTDQSAELRASLEAATSAAIEPHGVPQADQSSP